MPHVEIELENDGGFFGSVVWKISSLKGETGLYLSFISSLASCLRCSTAAQAQ